MITVYTCATNHRDALRNDQYTAHAKFVAYVDNPRRGEGVWEQRAACRVHPSPRRNARMHKILSHDYTESEYSVWMDANVSLKVPAQLLVREWLGAADLAVFMHRTRVCTYAEANRCIELGLDAEGLIVSQIQKYKSAGLPSDLGLPETSVVVRKQTAQIREFNEAWWEELKRYSVRDQVSFMYAARQCGLKVNLVLPTKYVHPYFSITNRPPGREEPRPSAPTGVENSDRTAATSHSR